MPPGPRELRDALARASSQEVILFGHDPGLDEPIAFLQRLAGLARFVLRTRDGQFDLERAAAATAQRVDTVRAGLECLAAQGQLIVVERQDGQWRLARGDGRPDLQQAESAHALLNALLAETAAYRAYLLAAPAESVVRR